MENINAYCVKCKTKRPIKEPVESKTARGTRMIRGKCSVCGCNVSVLVSKK